MNSMLKKEFKIVLLLSAVLICVLLLVSCHKKAESSGSTQVQIGQGNMNVVIGGVDSATGSISEIISGEGTQNGVGEGGGQIAGDVGGNASGHKHSFASEWTFDGSGHWYGATCEHTSERIEFYEHDYQWEEIYARTCGDITVKNYWCVTCGYTKTEESEPLPHDEIAHEAKAPTCYEVGWNAYITCSRCGYTTYEELPAEHKLEEHEAKAPTCTEIGWNAYVVCLACDYNTRGEDIPMLPHNEIKHEGKKATCTEIGWEAYVTCADCDYTTYVEIEPSHEEISHEAKDATCTSAGWAAYVTCADCDYSTFAEIPPTHEFEDISGCGECGLPFTDMNWYEPEKSDLSITNAHELAGFAKLVNEGNSFEGKVITVENDISLLGIEWEPIGKTQKTAFKGSFCGNGHVISDFKITKGYDRSANYLGLFGVSEGKIADLGVENFTIELSYATQSSYAGGLVGRNIGDVVRSYAEGGKISISGTSYESSAGGLIGISVGGVVNSCYAKCNVSAVSDNIASSGGFIGSLYYVGIVDSYSTGSASAIGTKSASAGGFIGLNFCGTLEDSYATGAVYAESPTDAVYSGGFVGQNRPPNNASADRGIKNCYCMVGQTVGFKRGSLSLGAPTNNIAPAKELSELNSSVFIADVLCWNDLMWKFGDGRSPTLIFIVI